ncbi:uncharacterized protein LOC125647155 [Ostrea edulis]|uniref:uncharacterized protein LOC125647155 n=1 Tax=Ostrea edulis TaxID=37623 RepID=UPI0024AF0097|nr:uncharacterized protein LOC125647155 [Ostrea edulis]
MDGTGKKDYRMTTPRIFSPNSGPPEKDSIALYREFVRRRPEEAKSEESPMYLTPIPMKRLLDSSLIWYYPRPMGKNTLGTLVKNAAIKAGLEGKLTNHSLRKSTVTALSKAGVAPHKIQQITGHKSLQSIAVYDSKLTIQEQKQMCSILSNENGKCS